MGAALGPQRLQPGRPRSGPAALGRPTLPDSRRLRGSPCRDPVDLSVNAARQRYYWVVADDGDVDLCLTDPGFEVDVVVDADLRTLTEVWMGDARFADALADGRITHARPTRTDPSHP